MLACQKTKHCENKRISGAAALSSALLISGIVLLMVAAGAFLSFSFARGNFGAVLAAKALSGARTGVDDAIYRIIKNNYAHAPLYCLSLTGVRPVNVSVVIERDPADLGVCVVAWGCRYRIRSTGKALFQERRVEAILSVDSNTREIRRESFREIEIREQDPFPC